MSSGEPDLEHLRQWIGAEESVVDWVSPGIVARLNATLGLPGNVPSLGDPAPRLIHFCLCQPAVPNDALGEDGHPARGGFLPPVPLPRRMWAASDIRFTGDLRVGDSVTRRSRVADVVVKNGRSGALCFVTVDHVYEAGSGPAVTDRQTLVYRAPPDAGAVPPAGEPAPAGAHHEVVNPDPALLFRYSAVTFNSHRIHYDLDYATRVEGYPGLVVQGPLQASMLLHFAARLHGRAPDAFTFRGLSSLTHREAMTLHAGAVENDAMALWTASPGGPIAMQAEARWS